MSIFLRKTCSERGRAKTAPFDPWEFCSIKRVSVLGYIMHTSRVLSVQKNLFFPSDEWTARVTALESLVPQTRAYCDVLERP